MAVGKYDITLRKYNSYAITFQFDYDITNIDFYSEIRNSKNELVATFSITKDELNKTIIMTLTENEINSIVETNCKYDIKQVSNGFETTIVEGKVTIVTGITQAG